MKKINAILSILALAILLLSSCSKPKYTASFAPSKPVRYTKVEKDENVIKQNKAYENILASSQQNEIVKINNTKAETEESSDELIINQSSFTKKEEKNMKKQTRKILFKEAKKNLFKKSRPDKDTQLIAAILSIFIPPLGVWYYQKDITTDFWLSLLLWFIVLVPGIVYALLVIFDVITLA